MVDVYTLLHRAHECREIVRFPDSNPGLECLVGYKLDLHRFPKSQEAVSWLVC